jgi:hypothetical protein
MTGRYETAAVEADNRISAGKRPACRSLEASTGLITQCKQATPFIAIPPELHLQLFKQVGLCVSVYLGTTCKKTYEIYYEMHGKSKPYSPLVGRYSFYHTVDGNSKTQELLTLIKDLIG